jgi:hypothetical protein
MRLLAYPLPSVAAEPAGAACKGGACTCEGQGTRVRFTGQPPFALRISMAAESKPAGRGGGAEAGQWDKELDDIHERSLLLKLPPGDHVVTEVRDVTCSRAVAVPLAVHPRPQVEVRALTCKHLCKDETASLFVNLTRGTPPFEVTLTDQHRNVVAASFNVSAGEFRIDRAAVRAGDPDEVLRGWHNWTVAALHDAECPALAEQRPAVSGAVSGAPPPGGVKGSKGATLASAPSPGARVGGRGAHAKR